MAIAEAELVNIRPSLPVRIYLVVFGLFWCGLVGAMLAASVANGPGVPTVLLTLMLIVGVVVTTANLRARVVAGPTELRVVNFAAEQRYPRSSIDRFIEHTPGALPRSLGGVTMALLRDGRSIELRATMRGPFGTNQRQRNLEALQRWLGQ
ncbi:MAG: hypothetical protein AAGA42_06260 [Actinomycetota bacterium]